MHHIEIYVRDLVKSKPFYYWLLETLDFKLFQEWDEGFSYRKNDFYLVFVQVREKYKTSEYNRCHVGLNHLAFHCDSCEKITMIREHMINHGVSLLYDDKYPHASGKQSYALFFEDPDRIKIEIVWNKS
ncbi:VOC family protein [Carnobacteriaceae bacterium zg-ZUI252]|nr:VOC family protein [Carnobacteriaceae bacterium zg-ZUI252]